MELINHANLDDQFKTISGVESKIVIEADQMPNAVLKRLMEEVKNDQANSMFAYDRAHNRHNRS